MVHMIFVENYFPFLSYPALIVDLFDYYGLSTIMGYHGLLWIILDYG